MAFCFCLLFEVVSSFFVCLFVRSFVRVFVCLLFLFG